MDPITNHPPLPPSLESFVQAYAALRNIVTANQDAPQEWRVPDLLPQLSEALGRPFMFFEFISTLWLAYEAAVAHFTLRFDGERTPNRLVIWCNRIVPPEEVAQDIQLSVVELRRYLTSRLITDHNRFLRQYGFSVDRRTRTWIRWHEVFDMQQATTVQATFRILPARENRAVPIAENPRALREFETRALERSLTHFDLLDRVGERPDRSPREVSDISGQFFAYFFLRPFGSCCECD